MRTILFLILLLGPVVTARAQAVFSDDSVISEQDTGVSVTLAVTMATHVTNDNCLVQITSSVSSRNHKLHHFGLDADRRVLYGRRYTNVLVPEANGFGGGDSLRYVRFFYRTAVGAGVVLRRRRNDGYGVLQPRRRGDVDGPGHVARNFHYSG